MAFVVCNTYVIVVFLCVVVNIVGMEGMSMGDRGGKPGKRLSPSIPYHTGYTAGAGTQHGTDTITWAACSVRACVCLCVRYSKGLSTDIAMSIGL